MSPKPESQKSPNFPAARHEADPFQKYLYLTQNIYDQNFLVREGLSSLLPGVLQNLKPLESLDEFPISILPPDTRSLDDSRLLELINTRRHEIVFGAMLFYSSRPSSFWRSKTAPKHCKYALAFIDKAIGSNVNFGELLRGATYSLKEYPALRKYICSRIGPQKPYNEFGERNPISGRMPVNVYSYLQFFALDRTSTSTARLAGLGEDLDRLRNKPHTP